MSRKLVVIVVVGVILVFSGLPSIVAWLDRIGIIGWARSVKAEYITGTAITIIVVLLFVLPSENWIRRCQTKRTQRCPVCEASLYRDGRYCPACGSRVTL